MAALSHNVPERRRLPARGAVAIELALLFTILFTIGVGVVDVGRAIYSYDAVTKSVRDAARHLTQFAPGDTARRTEASCLVRYGNTACTGNYLAVGLDNATVAICDASNCANTHRNVSTGRGVLNLVTVTVRGYQYPPITTALLGGSISFADVSVTMSQVVP